MTHRPIYWLRTFLRYLLLFIAIWYDHVLRSKRKAIYWLRTLLRYVLLLVSIPSVYLGGVCLALLWHEHEANLAFKTLHLPQMPAPSPSTRLLVFAPHPDDEILGCGGLIQQTLAAGGKVKVVIFTNGDGFRTAVECLTHRMNVGPADFIKFGAKRQEETCEALAKIGLQRKDILFLGYPDQGLEKIWLYYWGPTSLYRSPYTHADHVPYSLAFHPNAPYSGQSVLADVESILNSFLPTLIAVTHPQEDHPDHRAASYFVTLALSILKSHTDANSWAQNAEIVHYLVHHGDWPQPQGLSLEAPLVPPHSMAHIGTQWMALPLTAVEESRKLQGIRAYRSQMVMMARFLASFARRTELFGVLQEPTLLQDRRGPGEGAVIAGTPWWQKQPPVFLDPIEDSLLRTLEGGADLRAICACRSENLLCLDLEFCEPVSARYRYWLLLRAFGPQGETAPAALRIALPVANQVLPGGGWVHISGRHLLVALPWDRVRANACGKAVQQIWVGMEDYLAKLPIERSGMCFIRVSATPLQKEYLLARQD